MRGLLEQLERRQLLSSSLSGGVLYVYGTPSADTIGLRIVGSKIRVSQTGAADKDFTSSLATRIRVYSYAGNDTVTIASSISKPAVIYGGTGNDTVKSGGGKDSIYGGDGEDSLAGGANNDFVRGDADDDVLLGEAGNDTLDGDTGNDTLNGGSGNDTASYETRAVSITAWINVTAAGSLVGGGGRAGESDTYSDVETLVGGSAADTLSILGGATSSSKVSAKRLQLDGHSGNDTLISGANATSYYPLATLMGGTGIDNLIEKSRNHNKAIGDTGNDLYEIFAPGSYPSWFDGGSGTDRVDGHSVSVAGNSITMQSNLEEVVNFAGIRRVTGNSLNNLIDVNGPGMTISGGSGNDTIYGSDLADSIYGGTGNDSLIGGKGADMLSGGTGNDVLVANDSQKDTLYGGTGTDRARRDLIDLIPSTDIELFS